MSSKTATAAAIDENIEASANPWITLGASVGVLVAVALSYHVLQKNHSGRAPGINWLVQGIYWGILVAIVFLLPTSIAQYIFSGLTVTLMGTVFPIYESIRAVCTPEEDDDKAWLQYWIAGGVIFMCTTWVDDVIKSNHSTLVWFECLTFLFLWLYFPLTDGASILYDYVTEPYLAPLIRPLAKKMDGVVAALYQTLMNAAHLWVLWLIFMFLPSGLKRIVAIGIGTFYPFISSVTASATEEIEDDTYWLTYWSCYGCLFLIMDLLETWLGWIPGFYSLVIFSTVYMMLPMFQGAEKIFRKVLVPLAGLQELLMLRDAISVKKAMLKTLDPERAKTVRKAIAKFYAADDDGDDADPLALKNELMQGWKGIQMPKMANPFAKKMAATETTSLIV